MKKYFIFILILTCTTANVAHGDQKVMVGEASLSFLLPEFWSQSIGYTQTQPTLDPSNPLLLTWKRAAINDTNGRAIMPGLNIATFHVPQDTNLEMASVTLLKKRNSKIVGLITREDGLSLPNSLGFVVEQPVSQEITLTALVIHAINKEKFVEIVFSTTPETWQQAAPEFDTIMRSLVFDKDRAPLYLEKIEYILPPGISISSLAPAPIGAQLIVCVRNPVAGAKFLKALEEDIGLFRLTNISRTIMPNRPMRYNLMIYGDSTQLKNKQEVSCQ